MPVLDHRSLGVVLLPSLLITSPTLIVLNPVTEERVVVPDDANIRFDANGWAAIKAGGLKWWLSQRMKTAVVRDDTSGKAYIAMETGAVWLHEVQYRYTAKYPAYNDRGNEDKSLNAYARDFNSSGMYVWWDCRSFQEPSSQDKFSQ